MYSLRNCGTTGNDFSYKNIAIFKIIFLKNNSLYEKHLFHIFVFFIMRNSLSASYITIKTQYIKIIICYK